MKRYFNLIFLLIIFFNFASHSFAQDWVKQAGGKEAGDKGNAITVDQWGFVYVTGKFSGITHFDSQTLISYGSSDVFIAKYDSLGNLVWVLKAGGPNSDIGHAIKADNKGNIVVAGFFMNSFQIGSNSIISGSGNNFFLVKLDSAGNVIWLEYLEGGFGATDMTIDMQGYIDIIGILSSPVTIDTNIITPYYYAPLGPSFWSWDILLLQYDSAGNLQWYDHAGGYGDERAEGITVDKLGNIYITGSFDTTAVFGGQSFSTYSNNIDRENIFLAKYNVKGDLQWFRKFGSKDATGYGISITLTNSAKLALAGNCDGATSFDSITLVNKPGSRFDYFVVQMDTAGEVDWAINIGNHDQVNGKPNGIAADPQGNIFVTGAFEDTFAFGSFVLYTKSLALDMFIIKLDSTGNMVWAKSGGGTSWDHGYDVASDVSGNVYVTGSFYDSAYFGPFILKGLKKDNILIARYGYKTNGEEPLPAKFPHSVTIYPNPFSEFIFYEDQHNSSQQGEIRVINLLGETVYSEKAPLFGPRAIALNYLSKGIYFLRYSSENSTKTFKIIKQ